MRCSTPTATTRSSVTGSCSTRPATKITTWPSGQLGGSARPTAGGRRSARSAPATASHASPQTPAFEDLLKRNFTAETPNTVWFVDITDHLTGEGKLYPCALKDVY